MVHCYLNNFLLTFRSHVTNNRTGTSVNVTSTHPHPEYLTLNSKVYYDSASKASSKMRNLGSWCRLFRFQLRGYHSTTITSFCSCWWHTVRPYYRGVPERALGAHLIHLVMARRWFTNKTSFRVRPRWRFRYTSRPSGDSIMHFKIDQNRGREHTHSKLLKEPRSLVFLSAKIISSPILTFNTNFTRFDKSK